MTLPSFDNQTIAVALACPILLNLAVTFFVLVRIVRKQGGDVSAIHERSPKDEDTAGTAEDRSRLILSAAPPQIDIGLPQLAIAETLVQLDKKVSQLKADLDSIKKNQFENITFEFDEIFRRERSRLASPYPRLFRIDDLPGEPAMYEKVGLVWRGRISFYPLCEHEACKGLRRRKELQQRYVFSESHLTITPRFIGNVVKIAFMAFGHQIHGIELPITFIDPSAVRMTKEVAELVKEAADLVPEPAKELVEHLEPDILGASVEKLITHLTIEPKEALHFKERGAWETLKRQLEAEVRSQLAGREAAMLETGSTGHLLMGKLMEKQDSREERRIPHGGLVRVLKEEKTSEGQVSRSKYLWVCEKCRNESFPEYRLLSTTAPTP